MGKQPMGRRILATHGRDGRHTSSPQQLASCTQVGREGSGGGSGAPYWQGVVCAVVVLLLSAHVRSGGFEVESAAQVVHGGVTTQQWLFTLDRYTAVTMCGIVYNVKSCVPA